MTPEFEIAELDRALAADGQDIELWRVQGSGVNPAKVKVGCRAFVRRRANKELVGAIVQNDDWVIMSPSEIVRTGWPGPWTPAMPGAPAEAAQNPDRDYRLPRKGDKAVINGIERSVEVVKPIYLDNTLIRIEMQVLG